ncbi:MAG: ribosome silencing factor [Oscillospiraceae bacterium]|jgi:ribosome-associated protein|nr:ribosome silencing factor [Oscillospiraceae bacterium]
MQPNELAKAVVKVLDDKKGEDIRTLAVGGLTIVADYFVVVSGMSSTHINALSEAVQDELAKQGIEPRHVEGRASGWVLLDYASVLVHIFGRTEREYYNIERLFPSAAALD